MFPISLVRGACAIFGFEDGSELWVTPCEVTHYVRIGRHCPFVSWIESVDSDRAPVVNHYTRVRRFGETLTALIAGVLAGLPPYGLLDYVLEYGPDKLRAELEPRMAAAFN